MFEGGFGDGGFEVVGADWSPRFVAVAGAFEGAFADSNVIVETDVVCLDVGVVVGV